MQGFHLGRIVAGQQWRIGGQGAWLAHSEAMMILRILPCRFPAGNEPVMQTRKRSVAVHIIPYEAVANT